MIRETLNLTSFILSAEIANEQNIRKMKIMSSTDLLTGVYNRNAMNNRISDNGNGTRIIEAPFGVFFIDVNGLKTTNDTKGHLAGDELLKDVAATLREYKSEQMEVYRVGGDEFQVLALDYDESDVKRYFERFNGFLADYNARTKRPYKVYASFGYAVCTDKESHSLGEWMTLSDNRMYESKAAAKARRKAETSGSEGID